MDNLTEGRVVHYVLPESGNRSPGEHRPAIVVKVWRYEGKPQANGCCNLSVLTDYTNDFYDTSGGGHMGADGMFWATSIVYDKDGKPSTWHWIEE